MNTRTCLAVSSIAFCLWSLSTAGAPLHAQGGSGITDAGSLMRLLMRADDMGNSYGRTLGIIKAHREGIITSASIMPTSQFFEESVRLCKQNPKLAIGIHITLFGTRTRPVLSPESIPSLVTPEGFFYEALTEVKHELSIKEMEAEITAQVERVKATGLRIVYLDWHRSVPKAAMEIITRICDERKLLFGQERNGSVYGHTRIPLMRETWPSLKAPDGQSVLYAAPSFGKEDQEFFFNALSALKPGKWLGVVHPGTGEPQRASVLELLCSPRTKEIIKSKNIQLVSYNDLWDEVYGKKTSR
jgi:chitin disaccharide deacetylase